MRMKKVLHFVILWHIDKKEISVTSAVTQGLSHFFPTFRKALKQATDVTQTTCTTLSCSKRTDEGSNFGEND